MAFSVSEIIAYICLFVGLYFQVFLLFTFIENNRLAKARNSEKTAEKSRYFRKELPSVTIAVPCYNESQTLVGTIESLMALEYPKEKLTVMVIDDGSSDDTYDVALEMKRKYSSIAVHRKENGGKYTALNFALSQSKSEFFGCLDADSFVHPQALAKIIATFTPEIMAVTPSIVVHKPENIIQRVQRIEYNLGVFVRHTFSLLNALQVTPGPFSIFRAKVFQSLGGYRHAYNTEDMEIAMRMQTARYKIGNCPDAFVYTVTPDSVRKLYKQRVRWTSGFLRNALDYRHLLFNAKYGHLGIITLPFAIFSIATILYFSLIALVETARFALHKLTEFQAVGLTFPRHMFDWYFVGVHATQIVIVAAFVLTAVVLLIGKKMAEGNMKFTFDFIYFLVIYPFIPPFWLATSVWNALFSRATTWR